MLYKHFLLLSMNGYALSFKHLQGLSSPVTVHIRSCIRIDTILIDSMI